METNYEQNLQKAIADMLGVEDIEETIKSSQKVAEITETTDLELTAKFDINAWLEE